MTCSLDFVNSIAASPTVRLALANGPTWIINAEETDFSPAPLREAVAQTLMSDGGVVSASTKDFRRVTLGLFLEESSPDAAATALQALYRELDWPGGNILRWHEHTTHPVFFRTYRASPSSVRSLGRKGTRKRIRVELRAEPFAYGPLETPVSAVTVSTDPAAGSNGCFVDVTGVKGDVETPALIQIPATAVFSGRTTVIAARRRGTPSGAPFLFQAEAMTQGTDTTTQVNDANFSGAGNNYSRCTFATATMQTRLTLTDLGTASVDLRGTYRVYLRYRKNTSADDINVRIRWGDPNSPVTNDSEALPDTTALRIIDLGLISVPHGEAPVYDRSGVELVADDDFTLTVQAERTAGSGTLDLDYLQFVPADDRYAPLAWGASAAAAASTYWLDAYDNSIHARNASGQVVSAKRPQGPGGGLPMLTPNQTNRIYLFHVATSGTHLISGSDSVSVSYLPHYLSVRPAST